MPQSTDPDVRKYDGEGETVTCSECHAFMVPLQNYEISKSESPAVSMELWELVVWGWWAVVGNYLHDALTLKGRIQRLAQQKAQMLPLFPRSRVGPRCGHVLQRP